MKVGVIGAGAWGTALSIVSARNGNDTVLWSYDGQYKHFDDVTMPNNLIVRQNIDAVSNMDAWLLVTPAAFFRETLQKTIPFYKDQPIIICTKGAEPQTGNFMSEIVLQELPHCTKFGVLSGPQFAHEVANGIPTGSTLAGPNDVISVGTKIFSDLYISASDDIIGTEICGVGKNAVALICGYNSIVARGENERAMMLTRAWCEITTLGIKCGAKEQTFLDLCGLGDLFLSATSPTSRNFSGGMAIANGEKPSGTVEGIFALSGLVKLAQKNNVSVPILSNMKNIMKL